MQAIQIDSTGGAEVLVLRDVPEPIPGSGEILIRVDAAGVNFSDIMWRRGEYGRTVRLGKAESLLVASQVCGRSKLQIQAYLSAMVQNLKRLACVIYLWVLARWLSHQS